MEGGGNLKTENSDRLDELGAKGGGLRVEMSRMNRG
jgi:hypothetical protein